MIFFLNLSLFLLMEFLVRRNQIRVACEIFSRKLDVLVRNSLLRVVQVVVGAKIVVKMVALV